MRSSAIATVRVLTAALGMLCLGVPAAAQPTADQVLTAAGFSADDKQRVLNGEFVTGESKSVSDRDLAIAMAFMVKTSPDALSRQIIAGSLITSDAQVKAHAMFKNPGSPADLAALKIPAGEAKTLSGAQPGSDLNLSADEIAAFAAVPGGNPQAVQQQLQQMLLRRYQSYRASGLAGIAPYARGSGSDNDLAGDLRKATEAAKHLQTYLPKFHAVLLGYPKGMEPPMQENFFWIRSIIQGKPTYILQHTLAASEGPARAVVQRQYYVSTGYNGEQAIAGFLPVSGGTLVVYGSHAFSDQVAGFGGFAKRGIGSRIMADQLKKIFEAGRTKAVQ